MKQKVDYSARIGGRAGRASGLLPKAAAEQRTPTWVVDGIVNRTVRKRRKERIDSAVARAEQQSADH